MQSVFTIRNIMKNQEKIQETIKYYQSQFPKWFEKNAHFEKRLIFTKCWETLKNHIAREFIILQGLRQVGKTTILQQLIYQISAEGLDSKKNIIYLSLDQTDLIGVSASDFLSFLNENINHDKITYIFLDEIQILKNWDMFLKNVWDSFPNIKIIASGSSALEINLKERGSLRFDFVKICPLSFKEYLYFKHKELFANMQKLPKLGDFFAISQHELRTIDLNSANLKTIFRKYLFTGSYPGLLFQNISVAEYQRKIVQNVYQKTKNEIFLYYLNRIDEKKFGVKIKPEHSDRIVQYLITNNGSETSYRTLAEKITISKDAVYANLQLLTYASLLNFCKKIKFNGETVLNASFKYYLHDHTLYLAMKKIDAFLKLKGNKGFVYENLIFNYLNQSFPYERLGFIKLKKSEIDFALFLSDGQKYLFEGKSNNWDAKRVKNNFLLSEAKNFLKICITEDYLGRKNEILYIPIYLFLLLKIV